jgi:peptide deformylase
MTYNIDKTNSLLKQAAEEFDFSNPPENPNEIAKKLSDFLLSNENGAGIAANQLGLPYRAFAIKMNPMLVMFNPKIVNYSENKVYMEEGCLSFPGLYFKVKRPENIRIRFTLPNGEILTEYYEGMTARVIQHEYDHLNGIIFTEKATRYHLEAGKKRLKKKVYK